MSSSPRPFLHFGLLQALLAGALICLRGVLPASALERERIFGPEVKTGDYKHPASFTQLGNGDLYLVFFSKPTLQMAARHLEWLST